MCNHTDCAGSWAGAMACAVCRERDVSEMKLNDAELARLEELAGKATPGPWKEATDPSHFYTISTVLGGVEAQRSGVWQQMIIQVGGWADVPEQEANTRYIAAACNAAPALVAEVRRLRKKLEQVKHGMEAAYMLARVDARKAAEAENAALRDRVEALEKTKKHLSETARVLAEQVGKGNLGKIQDALDYAHYKASEREAMK